MNSGAVKTLTPTSTLIYAGLTLVNDGKIYAFPAAIPVISGSGFTIKFATGMGSQNLYYFAIGV